ncbi:WbqC family protein [Marinibacterium profundimaris]|uniref:WbqC-like protein n=1 Tax=Marinibacterium profundimaris TaxID=1679460 RepID=A0A225NDQ3_9RHOB|nr:WbqC family protein [Marinibacterium profundimaris]MAU94943.1 hypothetical protein [Fulvimarina sp.]OWU68403.1 hypothetical protein ATO3_24275 [Marinibacterium profundimaris]
MSRIAIMQPYLLPYLGYFRLMVDVDALVLGDVQQFPRRGWVHRNRLTDDRGAPGWLTLPLKPKPLGTRIGEIAFAEGAEVTFARNMARFAACRSPNAATAPLVETLAALEGTPLAVIRRLLEQVGAALGLHTPLLLQSDFHDPAAEGLSPTEQIIALCRALGADEYVNAPGGRALYDGAEFARHGVRLLFHDPYPGPMDSILQRMTDAPLDGLRREVVATATVQPA